MELKFTKELKSKWLEALKSGKYIQGTGALRETDTLGTVRHCCLGVLAEIHPDMTIHNRRDDVYIGKKNYHYDIFTELLGAVPNTYYPVKDELIETNDKNCDGKYTAVIPIIESIPTVD